MDDHQPSSGARPLPLHGPHRHCDRSVPASAGFAPLRLLVQAEGTVVELTKPDTLVGRHSEADVCLRLPDVSRHHCRFVYTDDHWDVLDLQSLNGVFVNGVRVRQATLHHRDTVRIGGVLLQVDLQPGSPALRVPPNHSRICADKVLGSIRDALPREQPGTGPDRLAS